MQIKLLDSHCSIIIHDLCQTLLFLASMKYNLFIFLYGISFSGSDPQFAVQRLPSRSKEDAEYILGHSEEVNDCVFQ